MYVFYTYPSYDSNRTIAAGINTLSEPVTVRRQIDKTYIHPNFLRSQPDLYDIAIVHLDQPLPLNDIPSIFAKTCVPAENELLTNDYSKPNSPLVVIGWDNTIIGGRISKALQQISVRMLDNEHIMCSSFIINNTYQFCAELPSDTRSRYMKYSCSGKNSLMGKFMYSLLI